MKAFITSPYFISLIAIFVACASTIISVALIYKSNKALRDSKETELKRDIYFELANKFAIVSASKKIDYEELIAACYKARLLLPESIGEVLMKITYKASIVSALRSEPTRDNQKISELNEQLYQLIEEAVSVMRKNIRNNKEQ